MVNPITVVFECENCGETFEVPVWNEIARDTGYLAVNLDCEDEVYCENCHLNDEDENEGED